MKITEAVNRSANASFTIEEVELDEPRPDEVLVRIVERVGSAVRKVVLGDRVALSFLSCGHCLSCDYDSPAYCHSMALLSFGGKRADGSKILRDESGEISGSFFGQFSFATFALASERNAVKVPDDVPLEIMGMLGAVYWNWNWNWSSARPMPLIRRCAITRRSAFRWTR